MEALVSPSLDTLRQAWQGRRVFITGHTGFKGSWLSLMLADLGAQLWGYSLPAPTHPSLFEQGKVAGRFQQSWHTEASDVRDLACLQQALSTARPEVVLHLAAQPLVRESYRTPVETFATNVMGTTHLLEAVRHVDSVKAVVVVTTDKVYENQEWAWAYREQDRLGGHDPYSASKACTELVVSSYRDAFEFTQRGVGLASARAGNVIGGGDWAADRLVPDVLAALADGRLPDIRRPQAVRPWQHVLEPLIGYLQLAQALLASPQTFSQAFNFGPGEQDVRTVGEVLARLQQLWGGASQGFVPQASACHEAGLLRLDASLARQQLGWLPRWGLDQALAACVSWQQAWHQGHPADALCLDQWRAYIGAGSALAGP